MIKNHTFHYIAALFFGLCVSMQGWAQKTVSTAQAQKVAGTFTHSRMAAMPLQLVYTATKNGKLKAGADTTTANVYYHIFNVGKNNGYIIVAGNDAAAPILGYSDSGSWDDSNLPPAMQDLLNQYQKEIQWAIDHKWKPGTNTQKSWANYRNGIMPVSYKASSPSASSGPSAPVMEAALSGSGNGSFNYTPGTTLLQTKWDQNAPYNGLYPTSTSLGITTNNGTPNPYTGCVVTALSQILYYWYQRGYTGNVVNNPEFTVHGITFTNTGIASGKATVSGGNTATYTFPGVPLNTTFDWQDMALTYNSKSSAASKTAVATLMQAVANAIAATTAAAVPSVSPAMTIYSGGTGTSVSYSSFSNVAYKYFGKFHPTPDPCWNTTGNQLNDGINYSGQYSSTASIGNYISFFGLADSTWGFPILQSDLGPYKNWLAGFINNGLPLFYCINIFKGTNATKDTLNSTTSNEGGHAVVCDGYDITQGDTLFHFNFGWSGQSNGFLSIDPLLYSNVYGSNTPIMNTPALLSDIVNSAGTTMPSQMGIAIFPTTVVAASPITLLNFTAKAQNGNTALLQWTTATESNNKGFAIQRSTDGANYMTIGFVNSQATGGNSSMPLNYNYTDQSPLSGNNYYRLQQTDLDGTTTYSGIANAQFNGLISIYPNPARSVVTVSIQSAAAYKLIDASGATVQQGRLQLGRNEISVSGMASGIYFLQIVTNNGTTNTHEIEVVK